MGGDFELIFLIFEEGIFVNIAEESKKKHSKDAPVIADRVKERIDESIDFR